MLDPETWLNEILPDGNPRHERLCFLIRANGGLSVTSWGCISYGHGHQEGLDQDDALELMAYSYFMRGLSAADVPIIGVLNTYMEEYIKCRKREEIPAVRR